MTFRKQKRGRIDGARLRRSGSSKKYFFSFSLKLNWASKVLLMLAFNLWTWLDSVISLFMGGNGLTFLLSAKEKNNLKAFLSQFLPSVLLPIKHAVPSSALVT